MFGFYQKKRGIYARERAYAKLKGFLRFYISIKFGALSRAAEISDAGGFFIFQSAEKYAAERGALPSGLFI